VTLERVASLHDDQGAHAVARELDRGPHEDVGGGAARPFLPPAPQSEDRDALEEPAQLVLEDHHEHDHEDCEEALEEPGGELHPELARAHVGGEQHADAAERRSGARAAQRDDHDVEDDRHEGDVERVDHAEIEERSEHAASRAGGVYLAQPRGKCFAPSRV
jgi:hypothetical protein